MDSLIGCLNDISRVNVIYTALLAAAAISTPISSGTGSKGLVDYFNSININLMMMMSYNTSLDPLDSTSSTTSALQFMAATTTSGEEMKPCLFIRMAHRLTLISYNCLSYIQNQFNEHTATSIASFSVLIILLSIICCFLISLMREEERKIREQYKKLRVGSSQSFVTVDGGSSSSGSSSSSSGGGVVGSNHNSKLGSASHQLLLGGCSVNQTLLASAQGGNYVGGTGTLPSPVSAGHGRSELHKLHVIELRRETYFGLVRLLKPGCRTIVLLCDAQSRLKLLRKFYQCIYPYRKIKTLQFAFLMIEKNIDWYQDLLKLALNEKRDLHINPLNCIGTVLVLNGFKKYFSVYHASDSRSDPDEQFVLLEESLLDNLPVWLDKLFTGKTSRYYVRYWPDQMR